MWAAGVSRQALWRGSRLARGPSSEYAPADGRFEPLLQQTLAMIALNHIHEGQLMYKFIRRAVPFLLSKLDQPARLILVSRYASALSSSTHPLLTIYT